MDILVKQMPTDELEAKYQDLLAKMRQIDNKYSTEYVDPSLDLPESLGLEKKEFTMPTTEELTEKAEQQHQAEYTEKQYEIIINEKQDKAELEEELQQTNTSGAEEETKLNEQYITDSNKLLKNCVKCGIMRSSIYALHQEKLFAELQQDIEKVKQETADKVDELSQKIAQVIADAQAERENLQTVFEQQVQATVTELLDQAYQQKADVLEYNNDVEQKENEYKFDRERAIFDAYMDESDRAFKAAELLAELGEVGLENQKYKEKVSLAKNFLGAMPKEDALYLLEHGEELKGHLGEYYAYVVDYITNL